MNTSVVSAYLIGAVVMVVLFLLAAVISNLIRYEAGVNPQDKRKRKLWFWVCAVLCPIVTFIMAYSCVFADIRVPSRQDAYMTAMIISSCGSFVVYVIIGFVLSRMFPHGKLASWF